MEAAHGIDSMPQTAENVADEFGISREDQDAFALRSQDRASNAIASGAFADEIMPVAVPRRTEATTVVAQDEHPRATTLFALAALRSIVRPGGSVTAGNASGVNDGAAAIILASESAILRHGLTPKARVLGMASAGVCWRAFSFSRPRVGITMFNLDQLAWTVIDGTAVFFDIAQDRYFSLPDERNRELVSSLAAPQSDFPFQPINLPRPTAWLPPVATSQAMEHGPFRLAEVARAVWVQRRIERRLTSRPFSSVLRLSFGGDRKRVDRCLGEFAHTSLSFPAFCLHKRESLAMYAQCKRAGRNSRSELDCPGVVFIRHLRVYSGG